MNPKFSKDFDSIKDLIKKVYELSINGIQGEKDNAQKKLDFLLNKYRLTIEQINDDLKERTFKLKGEENKRIATQIISMVTDNRVTKMYSYGAYDICCDLTAKEYIESKSMIKYYCNLYKVEKEKFLKAFILKNDLYPRMTSDEVKQSGAQKVSVDELIDMIQLSKGIQKGQYKQGKMIEE